MLKMTIEELCALSLCDAVTESVEVNEDSIIITMSGAVIPRIVFRAGKLEEILILGYEVLDGNEEVMFDMPDVEIWGDTIPDALNNLIQSKPHIVGFTTENQHAILTVTDNTDTYKLEISFSEILAE